MTKSAQEVVAKALWADGNSRIGHRPWAAVKNAYMAEAGHAIAALVANDFFLLGPDPLEWTVDQYDRIYMACDARLAHDAKHAMEQAGAGWPDPR